MGNKGLVWAAAGVLFLVFTGCEAPLNPGREDLEGQEPGVAADPDPAPVTDLALFEEIYGELLSRTGNSSSDDYAVSADYVCLAIDRAKGTTYADSLSEAEKTAAADVGFVLKLLDRANGGRTRYGDEQPLLASALPVAARWRSVVYGSDKFVAVAYSDNSKSAAYSADGVNWFASTLPSDSSWIDLAYGGGKFVTIARNSARAAYSADGIAWTAAALPGVAPWRSVAYGNGAFVAVSNSGAAYSTDGVDWQEAALPSDSSWRSVAYGSGAFVALAYNSDTAAYSADGVEWEAATLPGNAQWRSVAYGNGAFVAVSNSGAAYSADGGEWKAAALPGNADWSALAWGNGVFLAVARGSNKAAYSADGVGWTELALPGVRLWSGAAYGGGAFVAVCEYSDEALRVAYFPPGAINFKQLVDAEAVEQVIDRLVLSVDFGHRKIQTTSPNQPQILPMLPNRGRLFFIKLGRFGLGGGYRRENRANEDSSAMPGPAGMADRPGVG
jgi:hypothetical protein